MSKSQALTLATCQAANTVRLSRALADYLSTHLERSVHFVEDAAWQESFAAIAAGEIDVGWICGQPYVDLMDRGQANFQLLAAPVYFGARYLDRPVYYSDVVVRADSPFAAFEDLRGASWAYNEPGSQSGYHITCYHLAKMGEGGSFFGRVVESGGHAASLQMILENRVDAAAIDSTFLEWELARAPELGQRLRRIAVLGPSPVPPLVVSSRVDRATAGKLRLALLAMRESNEGCRILDLGALQRFVTVSNADYDPIRRMRQASAAVRLIPFF